MPMTEQQEKDLRKHMVSVMLASKTRKELREIAQYNDIKRGRNKQDTLNNLANSGKLYASCFIFHKDGKMINGALI